MKPSFSQRLLVVVILSMLLTASVSVSTQADAPKAGTVRWLTYVDPRFDFSIKYPSDWQVIPRDDSDPNVVSGLLRFVPTKALEERAALDEGRVDPHDLIPQVIIGHYLAELEDDQSLSEWTEMYESLSRESDRAAIQQQPRRTFWIRGAPAVSEEGVSPLTTYRFTNVAHHNMVWDIWTNIPSTDPYAIIYDRIVRSIRFRPNSPTNLHEAYGSEFVPMDMEEVLRINSVDQVADPQNLVDKNERQGPGNVINDLSNTWHSPVLKTSPGALRTVRCGSTAHSSTTAGSSYYAADISVADHTSVWNAKAGTVTFAGAKNNGYGNLVTVKAQGGKEAYYAHLESISFGTTTNLGKQIGTGFWIGWSGHSTCATCTAVNPHLHFHVHWDNTPMDLSGMVGFYPDTDDTPWPGTPGSGTGTNCAKMGR